MQTAEVGVGTSRRPATDETPDGAGTSEADAAAGVGCSTTRVPRWPAPSSTWPPAPLRPVARDRVRAGAPRSPSTCRRPSSQRADRRRRSAEPGELRRPGSVPLVEDTQAWGDRDWGDLHGNVRPLARAGDAVEPLVIDDDAPEPAADPVIGPELAAARTRLGLTVDQLADRTRIRPHVIEAIEVDDFAPLRRRLLRPRPPAHPGPGARPRRPAAAGDLRGALLPGTRRRPPGLPGRARHRVGRSGRRAAARTGRCWSPR